MRALLVLSLAVTLAAIGACGGDEGAGGGGRPPGSAVTPGLPEGPAPRGAQAVAGERVFADAGCLACHVVGTSGGDLGSDLTMVGARLNRRQLVRSLVDPVSPMPSFRKLPAAKRRQLVGYLEQLD
ncbi:MAG: c-type cytochrome [Solirubrobacteraceae bacterium]